MSESDRKAGIAQRLAGNVSTEGTLKLEPDNCLSVTGGMWWEDDDLYLAYINEDWSEGLSDNTWYVEEVNHMTRSGRYFKPLHLDQPEASREDKEVERQKEKQLEEEVVLKQLKKIQANIFIWGLLMASRVHRQAILSVMHKAKLSIVTTPEQLVGLVFPGGVAPTLTFSDKELPPEGSAHNKPLYISVECRVSNQRLSIPHGLCYWPETDRFCAYSPGDLGV